MKRWIIFCIFLLAFVLRFWQLGENPSSLDWDEASLGYNAYSILKTGKDEYGNFFPLSIRSFNDYKPPLYTYLTTIPVAIFGLNEFSTRFISALLGSLTVIIAYFLIKELFRNKSFIFYLLFLIFFAISPWHIQFSRIAFEANTALFFVICGIWLFLKGIKKEKYFILSFIFFALSLYSYHSPRLVVPLLIGGFTALYYREILKNLRGYILGLLVFIILFLPIIQQLRSTSARFGSVTVLNPQEKLGSSIAAIEYDQERGDLVGKLTHNRRIVYGREILGGYLDHFNFDFLFLTGDPPGRHHASGMGMLYFWDLPFVLIGMVAVLAGFAAKENKAFLWWFLVAPVASALTSGTPHAVRALLYLPTYQIFGAIGVVEFINFVKARLQSGVIARIRRLAETKQSLADASSHTRENDRQNQTILNLIVLITFFLFLLNFFYYLHMYYIHTPSEYSQWWQYGYKEAVKTAAAYEKDFNEVIVTYRYDQPYIFFLFYNQTDPSWYQENWGGGEIQRANRSFGKYEFRNIDWEKDQQQSGALLVGTPQEIPQDATGIIKEINFLDGSVAFRIVAR